MSNIDDKKHFSLISPFPAWQWQVTKAQRIWTIWDLYRRNEEICSPNRILDMSPGTFLMLVDPFSCSINTPCDPIPHPCFQSCCSHSHCLEGLLSLAFAQFSKYAYLVFLCGWTKHCRFFIWESVVEFDGFLHCFNQRYNKKICWVDALKNARTQGCLVYKMETAWTACHVKACHFLTQTLLIGSLGLSFHMHVL